MNEQDIVDRVIIKVVLPQAYQLIDELVSALGNSIPKDLRIRAGRLLPPQYVNTFSKGSDTP